LLLTSGLLTVLTATWFAVSFNSSRHVGLLWLPSAIGAVLLTVTYWRTSRVAALSPVTRRFWRQLAVAGALVGTASAVQAIDVLRHPQEDGAHIGPVMLSSNAAAVVVIMFALYRLPLGKRTAAERFRVTLDAGTIMVATAVFIWHFQTRHVVGTADATALVSSAFVLVLALVAVFAVAKVVLSGHVHIDKTALRILAAAMLVGSLNAPFAGVVEQHTTLLLNQLSIPVTLFIATCAGARQQHAAVAGGTVADADRVRSFSVLPYAAVAAVDGLLMATVWTDNADVRVVAGAAVLVTALVVLRQVTAFRDNHRLLDQLDHNATHDALTQLPNRVLFHQRLQLALADHRERSVSVVLIDLNNFKEVNDTLGHAVGDVLLVGVADMLRGSVRAGDTVARLGGDEFAVVVRGPATPTAELVIRDIIAGLGAGVLVEGRLLPAQASFGVVQAMPGDDPGTLLRRADIAMYESKARGDGGFTHYTPGMRIGGAELHQAPAELRTALHRDDDSAIGRPTQSYTTTVHS
jgi:diguanylate cyclase (GGDEF)-like protein